MLVVDSSVLVAHLRGSREATTFLRRHQGRGPVVVPTLAAFELWCGARTARQQDSVAKLLGVLQDEALLPAISFRAAALYHEQRSRGRSLPKIDLLIAAHALHHDAPLATLDRDYEGVEGLDLVKVGEP